MDVLREYGYWIRVAQERISRELDQLKGTNDRKKLSELYILAFSSFVGIDRFLSEDERIVRIESETSEEIEVERANLKALQELSATVRSVEAELHQVDDSEASEETPLPGGALVSMEQFRKLKAS